VASRNDFFVRRKVRQCELRAWKNAVVALPEPGEVGERERDGNIVSETSSVPTRSV
jgi:hypothetical protein